MIGVYIAPLLLQSLQSLSDSSLRCVCVWGGVVQSVIQTWHCLTVVSIGLLDTQSNTFHPLFNKDLNNFVITELVSSIFHGILLHLISLGLI